MSLRIASVAWLASLFLIASTTAQPAPVPAPGPGPGVAPAPGPGRGIAPAPARPPGGQGNFRGGVGVPGGPQHRQKQLEAIKEQIEAADDEWKALSPKVEKVLAAKQKM